MTDTPRLIEVAFPLRQASIDSVHEKNVRHGHISTLHIWPARRPLAASRAALIATLLPDPGDDDERKEILERLGGNAAEGTEAQGAAWRQRRVHGGRGDESAASCTGGGSRARTWTGSARRSARPTADGRRACSIPLPAAAPSRWRRCAWAAT